MKKIATLITILILTFSFQLRSQNSTSTFRVISNGSALDINAYVQAVQVADMEAYRYKTFCDTITFDNGVKIELYSALQLSVQGSPIIVSNYSDERSPLYIKPIFHLTEQGTLIASYQPVLTK